MGATDEAKNVARMAKGGVKKAVGDATGNDEMLDEGRSEAEAARADQAEEVARREREEGESPAEPASTMEGVMHADGR